jgi:hypothetical protein
MAGLLDVFNSFEGQQALGLLAAAGGRSDGAGFGQRLMEGLSQGDKWKAQQAAEKRAQMQDQMQQMQMQEYQQKVAERKKMQGLAAQFATPAVGMAADGFGPSAPGGFDRQGYAAALESIDPIAGMQYGASIQKDNSPISVAAGTSLIDRHTLKPLFTAPKEVSTPAELQGYQYAKSQGYEKSYMDYQKEIKRAGATNLSVNTDNLGLKPKDRFDMEDKMRNDYTAATKNDSEIINTAQDLKNILQQGGALKDQAAIYKFAKSLDPMGAVREADYAAIVKTAGGLDYVTSLVNKALTGEQLSPNQRKEMDSLMSAMAGVAQQRISKVQQRYGANAKMYNLQPENIFQQQSGENDGWGIVKK